MLVCIRIWCAGATVSEQTFCPFRPFIPGGPITVRFLSVSDPGIRPGGPGGPGGPEKPGSPFLPSNPTPMLPFEPGKPGGPTLP